MRRSPVLVAQLLIRGDTGGNLFDMGGVKATTAGRWGSLAASVFWLHEVKSSFLLTQNQCSGDEG